LWSLSARSSDYESSKVSSQSIQPLVDEVFMPMQSVADSTLLFGSDSPSYHVVSQPIQLVVEEVIVLMQSLVYPTLLLESVESTKGCNLRLIPLLS
jgi:hypothetical protein